MSLVNAATITPSICPAQSMSPERKKRVALEAVANQKSVSRIAQENNTSRKFIRQQREKAQAAVDQSFDLDNDDVLFYLPVTKAWIAQLVLALMLLAHCSYRHISMLIKDLFDYDLSQGMINAIFNEAVGKAREMNAAEDLSNIKMTANDELFHHNKPILSGIDIRSLYCYLLTDETQRDEETWAIHLMDAEDKGLKS